MELASLRAFVKVLQTGSFTRAAESLQTQKSYLSRVVTQLEKELGVRLLERTTRALSLTEVGREFFERALQILAAVDEAEQAVQKSFGEPRGVLRITCGVEFGMITVSHWGQRLMQQYPQVRVEAEYTGRIVDIVHEGFDLAIRVGPLADSTLMARKLGDLHYGLFVAPQYAARHTLPQTPQDLQHHDCLVFTSGRNTASWKLQHHDTPHTTVDFTAAQPRLRANNIYAVRSAALAGLGIAQLPLLLAHEALAAGQLQAVLRDWTLPTVPVHAVFASARYLTPKVRRFIDLAVASMQDAESDQNISRIS